MILLKLLFHTLFPAWKLFEKPSDSFRLYYREKSLDNLNNLDSGWREICYPTAKRNLFTLIFNPVDSQWLYFYSIFDELAQEISKNSNFELEASHFISQIKSFLSQKVAGLHHSSIQLKIVAFNENGQTLFEFVSGEFQCN